MGVWNFSDLKKHLGPSFGLRSNKYILEVPIPGPAGRSITIGCKSTSFPERKMSTTTMWYRGRKYNVRGETDYGDTFTVTFYDSGDSVLRRFFDEYMIFIDDSTPKESKSGKLPNKLDSVIEDVGNVISKVGHLVANANINGFSSVAFDTFTGRIHDENSYQTSVNLWCMDQEQNKIYGYKFTNAFVSTVGVAEFQDEDDGNKVLDFSVTFTFSEFEPLSNTSLNQNIFTQLFGENALNLVKSSDKFAYELGKNKYVKKLGKISKYTNRISGTINKIKNKISF